MWKDSPHLERFCFRNHFICFQHTWAEHFYPYCSMPRNSLYIILEQECSWNHPFQMPLSRGGDKEHLYIFLKTVLQVILQHASTNMVLCLNCLCTFMETAIRCYEHFLYPWSLIFFFIFLQYGNDLLCYKIFVIFLHKCILKILISFSWNFVLQLFKLFLLQHICFGVCIFLDKGLQFCNSGFLVLCPYSYF